MATARSRAPRTPEPHRLSGPGAADVSHRLRLIAGQVQGILSMVEDGRDYREVLIQVNAVRNALTSVRRLVFRDGIEAQLRVAADKEDYLTAIEELITLVNEGFRISERHGG